jgi:hypothetical protein
MVDGPGGILPGDGGYRADFRQPCRNGKTDRTRPKDKHPHEITTGQTIYTYSLQAKEVVQLSRHEDHMGDRAGSSWRFTPPIKQFGPATFQMAGRGMEMPDARWLNNK